MSLLTTKSKIQDSKLTLYERVRELHQEDAMEMARGLISDGLYRQTVTVLYSVLISHSVAITTKFNALALLKAAFQTGTRAVLCRPASCS